MTTAQDTGGLDRAQRHRARVLALSIAASIVVHAIVLLGFPGIGRRDVPRIEPIEVTLSKPEPPRIAKPPEPVAKPPPKPEPKPRQKEETRIAQLPAKAGLSPPPSEPPLLALPQTPLAQIPATQKPDSSVRAPAAGPEVSVRPEVAAAAPPAKGESSPAPAQSASAAKAARPDVRDASRLDSPVRYPRTAEKGRVTLKVLVTRDGRAGTVNLEKSSGYSNLDQHAVQEAKRWRFTPARQGSEPIEQWLTINIDY